MANLLDQQWKGTKEIGGGLAIPTTTVSRELEDLAMVKVVSRSLDSNDGDDIKQTTPYRWRLKETIARSLESSGLTDIMKAC